MPVLQGTFNAAGSACMDSTGLRGHAHIGRERGGDKDGLAAARRARADVLRQPRHVLAELHRQQLVHLAAASTWQGLKPHQPNDVALKSCS